MNLLPPGTYQVCIHYLTRHDGKHILDFTDIRSGERHTLRVLGNQLLYLSIALMAIDHTLDDIAGAQVRITVWVRVSGERAFNYVRAIDSVERLIPFDSGVPTPAMLAALPVLDFEDVE
jgi:hypothetical protein